MNGIADALNQLLATIQDHFTAYLMAVSSIGVLSMALIQLVKDLVPVKRFYHKGKLQNWLMERVRGNWETAEKDMVLLTAAGNEKAFYDLETEQLCGQMNSASQVVMENPGTFPALFKALAHQSKAEDIDRVMNPPATPPENGKPADAMPPETKLYLEARNRVQHFMQRNIDAFQIVAANSWKWRMRVTALVLSSVLSFIGLILFWDKAASGQGFALALLIAVLSSFLAPVARDLVAALQSLRK